MRSLLAALVFALALLADLTEGCAQERVVTPVVLQAPSVNVQQTFAYGERRGFFKQQGLDLRIVVIRPHLAAATLLSGGRELLFVGEIVELPTSGLGASDKFLKEHPMTVKRMLHALLRTTREMRERPADFGEFVGKNLKMDSERSIAAAESGSRTISIDGLLSDEAYRNLIEAGIESGAVKGTPNRDNAVDFTLLREVLREPGLR